MVKHTFKKSFKKAFNKTVEVLGDKRQHDKIRHGLHTFGQDAARLNQGMDRTLGIEGRGRYNTIEGIEEGVVRTLPHRHPKARLGRVVVTNRRPGTVERFW